jgi:diguanylate cyclase (GGDEF)-like protein/PAS domain S-box-containing protein
LNSQAAVPLIVLSQSREPVDAVNGVLRRAGQPAHCTWIPGIADVADALAQINPELLIVAGFTADSIEGVAKLRDQSAPEVPLILIADHIDEEHIATAMRKGARDVITLASPARVEAVLLRELRSFRLERALHSTLQSARDYRRQLETVLERSADAIAQIQEGIVVEANEAWLQLFKFPDRSALIGHPLMDCFDATSQVALKGALAACLQGRWSDHALNVTAQLADGSQVPLDLVMSAARHDGEPTVRLLVPARVNDSARLESELADAVKRDPATGLLHRRAVLADIAARLRTPAPGGVRYVAQVRLDKFAAIEQQVGVDASEQILVEFAGLLKTHLGHKDIAGRFAGVSFLVLLERGNERDVEAWADQLVEHTSRHVFSIEGKTLSTTCTVGVGLVPHSNPDLDAAIDDAIEACRRGRHRGGSQAMMLERADAESRVQAYDDVWVKHIKAALLENRFRLVQQPISSLHGDDARMADVMIRMVDQQGKEVLPSEFMPAAERSDLLKNIDRWVIGASLRFAAQRKPGCLFVRLSKGSALDASIPVWLDHQLKASKAQPARVCFQITEEVATNYQQQVRDLVKGLKQRGLRIAIERFGAGRDPYSLLSGLPLDFIKIDGALVQGLAVNEELQAKVRTLVELATHRKIETIAERVEDANTMAVLWQLGVQFVQGYFINEPEEVVLRAEK